MLISMHLIITELAEVYSCNTSFSHGIHGIIKFDSKSDLNVDENRAICTRNLRKQIYFLFNLLI